MSEDHPWWDKAIRGHCDENGPSGSEWNVSALLALLHRCAPKHAIAPDLIEIVARAVCEAQGEAPDCLYEHHEWEEWAVDVRREYRDAYTGELRVFLSHRAWRRYEKAAAAALTALSATMGMKIEPAFKPKEAVGPIRSKVNRLWGLWH